MSWVEERVSKTSVHTADTWEKSEKMCSPSFSTGASAKGEGNCGDCTHPPRVGKFPWRRARQPPPVFCLENPMDRGAWQAIVHRAAKNGTRLKRFSSHCGDCMHPGRALWGLNKVLLLLKGKNPYLNA